jgi:hypothetical protein
MDSQEMVCSRLSELGKDGENVVARYQALPSYLYKDVVDELG